MNLFLFGICYDKTQTFRKGSAKAPNMIRKIFPKLETFVNGIDLSERVFIKDLGNIYPKNFSELLKLAKEKLKFIPKDALTIVLGGEHTISYACVKPLNIKSFVCFDAHPDCENTNKHDGVVRRIAEEIGSENIYLYGVRCLSKNENEFLKNSKIKLVKKIKGLKKIPHPVYLSVDFDIFDPSILPTVGNPEPEGLKFSEVLKAIRVLSSKISVVDFVEFTPFKERRKVISDINKIYTLLAGKFIYSVLAEIDKSNRRLL